MSDFLCLSLTWPRRQWGAVEVSSQKIRSCGAETGLSCQISGLQDSEHGGQLRREVPDSPGGISPHTSAVQQVRSWACAELQRNSCAYENRLFVCSYEPELFPGLIYRMIKPRIVLLIFVSGKVVLTGKTPSMGTGLWNCTEWHCRHPEYKEDVM